MTSGPDPGEPVTSVALDDIIFRLQQFGGASDFWRQLSSALAARTDLAIEHHPGRAWQRVLPVRTRADVLHSSHFRTPLGRDTACVTTVHDLTYELGKVGGRSAPLNLWQRRHAVRRADAVVCISDHTRRELMGFYGPILRPDVPVVTIHHGRTYAGPAGGSLPDRLPHDRPFVLHVGNRSGYKNFATGLRGFARSGLARSGVELWCTGTPLDADERALVEELRVGARVRSLGLVSTDELGVLYEHALALLYPSAYEGFGLPPLDAMSLGCPVVASDASSVPEIVDGAGLLVDPASPDAFAEALRHAADPSRRAALVEAGRRRAEAFSWSRAADQYAAVYRDTAGRR